MGTHASAGRSGEGSAGSERRFSRLLTTMEMAASLEEGEVENSSQYTPAIPRQYHFCKIKKKRSYNHVQAITQNRPPSGMGVRIPPLAPDHFATSAKSA